MATNQDWRDLFAALSEAGAEFLLVGGHAVMFHSVPRYTKDLDIWVRPTNENAARVHTALATFGAPLADLTVADLSVAGTIFQIGVAPNRIDIITSVDGLEFGSAWSRRASTTYGGVPIGVLCIDDLIANKRRVGRPQDLLDVDQLERRRKPPTT